MRVCLGGTFYPLHKGHKILLKKAFQIAGPNGSVFIGITSTVMAKKKGLTVSFKKRKETIEQFLSELNLLKQAHIQRLSNKYGSALEKEYDAIVVSPETKPTAEEINEKRKKHKKQPLQIFIIPLVLSEDSQPISSSRIRRREIDENGLLLDRE